MHLVMAEPAFDPIFAPKHHGVAGAAPAHQVFREIDARLGEKGGARHGRAIDQGGAGAARADDTAEIPNRGPKIGPLGD